MTKDTHKKYKCHRCRGRRKQIGDKKRRRNERKKKGDKSSTSQSHIQMHQNNPNPSPPAPHIASSSSNPSSALHDTQKKTAFQASDFNPLAALNYSVATRLSVAREFACVYRATDDEEEWYGHGGIIAQIKNKFSIPRGTRIDHILRDYLVCLDNNEIYTGEMKFRSGRLPILATDSLEAQIAANSMEKGSGRKQAWLMVNSHRKEAGLPSVTMAAVCGVISRLKPMKVIIAWRKQGSYNPSSSSSRARYLWCLQLAIVFQVDGYEIFTAKYMEENGLTKIPSYLDKNKLVLISRYDVVWFDEVHRQVLPGTATEGALIISSSKKTILKFARDEDGKIDSSGKFNEDDSTQPMRVKYSHEARFCFGVYTDEESDGKKIGKRCNVFDYTQKIILSIKDYEKKILEEITRVKGLKEGGQWVIRSSKDTSKNIFLDDPVTVLPRIGKAAKKKMNSAGIATIQDLISADDMKLQMVDGISIEKMREYKEISRSSSLKETRPKKRDLRKEPNPYEARYGEDWREKIKSSVLLSKYCDIRELIDFLVEETKRAGKNYFYHDALSLLTAKESIHVILAGNTHVITARQPLLESMNIRVV